MLDAEAMLRQIDPDWSATPGGRLGLAVRLSDPAAVDVLFSEFAAEGLAVKAPWDAFWGQRYAVVSDPDSLHIDLYAQLSKDPAPSSRLAATQSEARDLVGFGS